VREDRPLVIYHAGCWDGFCAAWVARKALGDIEAVPAHYGTPPPDVKGREVYVLDFSYSLEVMAEMASRSSAFTVLDHHKTAERALADLEAMFITHNMAGRARYSVDQSGARMAWEFFAHIGGWLGMRSPWLVDYTEDRDLWRHALPDSENINAALRSYPLDFALWDEFSDSVGQREMFKREGEAIRRRERQIVADHIRHAREVEMDGHRVDVVNATVLFSEIAGELAKGRPFGACYFDRYDGKRQWSLRSDDGGVDVSAIAKAHGGGGHMRAAGFEEVAAN
jgi:oligoribonuclease NrnB/cAMP/cGMP phosphodiesterase (DHH superfamily)